MRPTCSYAFAVILALCCAITSLNAQSQATEKKRLLGTVAGKVSIKGKGATGIVVGLRQADTSNPFAATNKATTDQDGNYRIFDVLPGNYEVMPAAPAFVVSDGNRTVVMGEGERVEDLNFSLVRGGVITGKITDADGRALIQQQV